MKKCLICKKLLDKKEKLLCRTCFNFHLYKYPREDREEILREYGRSRK